MEEKLQNEIRELIGEFDYRELEEGLNTIYLIDAGKNEYVLKVHTNKSEGYSEGYRDDQKARFRAEARIYELVVDKTGVPSPEVVHTDFSEEKVPHQFYLMEKVEGENLDARKDDLTTSELEQLLRQYGRMLGEIHSTIELDSYGLVIENDGLNYLEEGDNWRESFRKVIENMRDITEERWESPPELSIETGKLIEELPQNPAPRLIHSDNRLENVLFSDGGITGFLDWSFTRSGDAMYDLARAEYMLIDYDLKLAGLTEEELERFRKALIEGYSEENTVEGYYSRRQVYRFITVLWIVAGFPKWSSDWSEERREEFRQELLERLEKEKPV